MKIAAYEASLPLDRFTHRQKRQGTQPLLLAVVAHVLLQVSFNRRIHSSCFQKVLLPRRRREEENKKTGGSGTRVGRRKKTRPEGGATWDLNCPITLRMVPRCFHARSARHPLEAVPSQMIFFGCDNVFRHGLRCRAYESKSPRRDSTSRILHSSRFCTASRSHYYVERCTRNS